MTTIKASGREHVRQPARPEVTVPPGGGPPTSTARPYSEVFFRFLEGDFEVSTLDDNDAPITSELRRGTPVSIRRWPGTNFDVGVTPGTFIAIHSPAVMEEFVREIGQQIDDPLNPPVPVGPASEEERQDDGDHPEVHGGVAA